MTIGIIDYNVGNLNSVKRAFEENGADVEIITSPEGLDSVEKIVLPGVGSFKYGMDMLNQLGFSEAIKHQVLVNKKPILGICLGMQLLFSIGFEDGETEGLNLIEGQVALMKEGFESLPIPHVGWNDLNVIKEHPLLEGIELNTDFYFVHSYQVKVHDKKYSIAEVDFGPGVCAVAAKENIYGVQFHPEKSHLSGFKIISNFINI